MNRLLTDGFAALDIVILDEFPLYGLKLLQSEYQL